MLLLKLEKKYKNIDVIERYSILIVLDVSIKCTCYEKDATQLTRQRIDRDTRPAGKVHRLATQCLPLTSFRL